MQADWSEGDRDRRRGLSFDRGWEPQDISFSDVDWESMVA